MMGDEARSPSSSWFDHGLRRHRGSAISSLTQKEVGSQRVEVARPKPQGQGRGGRQFEMSRRGLLGSPARLVLKQRWRPGVSPASVCERPVIFTGNF